MKSSLQTRKTKDKLEDNKNENYEEFKEDSEDNFFSTSKNIDDSDTDIENKDIKKHQRCVPLEIYKKVYKDKQTLLNQVELLNEEITTLNTDRTSKLKDKNDLMKVLDIKYKNLQREKLNIENILLNQENYVDKLKKKIEKLENQLSQKNEEILQKDNIIVELNDKIEELKNKINSLKQAFKLTEKKEIIKLNDKILSLTNDVEIKKTKIDFINKRHKHLQIKYLKLLGDKSKYTQDLIPLHKQNKEKEILSEIDGTSGNKNLDTIRSYSIKKQGNIINNNSKKILKEKNIRSLNLKLLNELYLPKIKKKGNRQQATYSTKNLKENKALKDNNYILSDYSDEENENKYKNEEFEENEEDIQ